MLKEFGEFWGDNGPEISVEFREYSGILKGLGGGVKSREFWILNPEKICRGIPGVKPQENSGNLREF